MGLPEYILVAVLIMKILGVEALDSISWLAIFGWYILGWVISYVLAVLVVLLAWLVAEKW